MEADQRVKERCILCVYMYVCVYVCMYVYIYIFFFIFFSIMVYYKIFNVVSCAIQ